MFRSCSTKRVQGSPLLETLESRTLLCGGFGPLSVAAGWPVYANSYDVGNAVRSAHSVKLSRTGSAEIPGSLYTANDADFFGMTATKDGIVQIGQIRGKAGCQLAAYDSQGGLLSSSAMPGAGGKLYLHVTAGERFYVAVTTQTAIGSYRLRITPVSDDYADLADHAAAIALAADGSASFAGRIDCPGDVDFRKVALAADGTVNITQLAFGGGNMLSVVISDSLGQDVTTTATAQGVSFHATANQTYYVKVTADGALGQYSFRLTSQADQPVAPPVTPPVVPPVVPPVAPPAPDATIVPQGVVTAREVVVGGVKQLLILGTNGADSIVVTQSGSTFTVTSGAGSQSFTDTISSVVMYGFGGDDTLKVTYSVGVATTMYGGDGNDQLFDAAQASATLDGGAGDNLFVTVGTPVVTIHGGSGLDSFWADADDTILNTTQAETDATSIHRIAQFYQPFTSDSSSPSYIPKSVRGQNFTDPNMGNAASRYANFAGKALFLNNGPSFRDIHQGGVGDCYFLASLASLAQNETASTRQMVVPLGDGTYIVRLYTTDSRGVATPTYLRMDADLPVTSYGSLAYADFAAGNDGIWVALVEKAYAYYRYGSNSYATINSGWMAAAYRDLTGFRDTHGQNSLDVATAAKGSALGDWIAGQLSAGHAVTLGSDSGGGPIVAGHAYMAQAVTTENGVQYVTVYNPWGVDGGGNNDSNPYDGLVKLTVGQALSYFTDAVSCQA